MNEKRKEIYDKDMEKALLTGITDTRCDVCGIYGIRVLVDGTPKIECMCNMKPSVLDRKKFYINISSHLESENLAHFTSTSNVNIQEITTHHVTIDDLMEGIRRDLLTAYPELMPRKMDWLEKNEEVAKRRGC